MTEKKTVTVKPVAKAVVGKTAEVKPAAAASVKEEVKVAEVKKEAEPAKKSAAKKAPVKKTAAAKKPAAKKTAAAKKPAAKKTAVKKVDKKPAAKKAAKAAITLEFKGNSYTEETLVQSAKDVWVYDLGKNLKDFKSVELYVKPEENAVYYVVNGEVTGSFGL